jgi:hypothetical protein
VGCRISAHSGRVIPVMPFRTLCQTDVSRYGEPTLDELLTDRGVRLLMARDHVDEAVVRQIANRARERIEHSASRKPAGAERDRT